MNAFQELPDYYVPWLDAQTQTSNRPPQETPAIAARLLPPGAGRKTIRS